MRFGASPRAGQAIILAAKARALLDSRPCVAREDLDAVLVRARLGAGILPGRKSFRFQGTELTWTRSSGNSVSGSARRWICDS